MEIDAGNAAQVVNINQISALFIFLVAATMPSRFVFVC